MIVTLSKAAITRDVQGRTRLSKIAFNALRSVHEQTLQPKAVLVVFEDPCDAAEADLVAQVKLVCPLALAIKNCRTGSQLDQAHKSARFGSINTGILESCHATSMTDPCWIAMLDPMRSVWRLNHLELCLAAARVSMDCRMIAATSRGPASFSILEETLYHADRSTLLVRQDLLFEAGLFDEAFADEAMGGITDTDLYLRLYYVCAGEIQAPEGPMRPMAISCSNSVETTESKEKLTHNLKRDAELFVYKYHNRLSPQHVFSLLNKFGIESKVLELHEEPVVMPECEPVPLQMWDGDYVDVRRDTFNVLSGTVEDAILTSKSSAKMLVGVITSNPLRIRGLIRDLGCALDSSQHCVVVFANSPDQSLPDEVLGLLQDQPFRRHIIRITDRIVRELTDLNDRCNFPLAIAQARTVLQTFLAATTDVEAFDAVAVIDDDMRLPQQWGVRDGDQHAGDILLSRAIKTPPNPTAMSMRTQLLDLVYALDSVFPKAGSMKPPLANNAWKCPSFEVYHDSLQDQYYDLSSTRWNHLEVPRRFDCTRRQGDKKKSLVQQWGQRMFVGDPLAREAVSMESGPSLQRGGCMVLPKKSFSLLRTAHGAPVVQLASGQQAMSRRSDSFWVEKHHKNDHKVAVVRTHLAVLHDNTHDSVPSPQNMREIIALEMVGAILCRPVEDRDAFVKRRTSALRCSTARIRGLCKTLRGRDYFRVVSGLEDFVQDLEKTL